MGVGKSLHLGTQYSIRFLMTNTHSCRMEDCRPWELSSPLIQMMMCERQGLPLDQMALIQLTCSNSCWRRLAFVVGPSKHHLHWNFYVNPRIHINTSLRIVTFVLLIFSSSNESFVFKLSSPFHSPAYIGLHMYNLSGGDSDSGQSSILLQKGCLQSKNIFKNQSALPFSGCMFFRSDWHLFPLLCNKQHQFSLVDQKQDTYMLKMYLW